MKILGIASPFSHDCSASIMVDGKVIAAVEEERFTREKHAPGAKPVNSVKFCLEQAKLKPSDIDYVAFPWAFEALRAKRTEYFFRCLFTRPDRAFKKFFKNFVELERQTSYINETLTKSGFDKFDNKKIKWVEHHLAHAASAFYFSGMKEACFMSIDAGGEISSTVLGVVKNNKLVKIKEIVAPDSLGDFYATMTDYLGFDRGDGEYKVMGMAPFGDAKKSDLSKIIHWDDSKKSFSCNDDYVWVARRNRFRVDKVYSKKMVKEFGPERQGDSLAQPYIHIAAATQKTLEEITLKLIETYLKKDLERHGNLCFAGGVALNVAMNRILLEQPYIKNLYVQPSSGDAGGSLGAAAFVANEFGEVIEPMKHAYLGPEYSNQQIEEELKVSGYKYYLEKDICAKVANLLQSNQVVGWFQGKMEWGPRALGNRSILGNPTIKGTADRINEIIKFREQWRPFCPSILKEYAAEILGSKHSAPFMTIAFMADKKWKERIPEVVHVDGTCRPQIVEQETNPRYYKLIENFHKLSGVPVVINTSLNRRGEPMICSPKDALVMFKECGLDYMAIGDFLVSKK